MPVPNAPQNPHWVRVLTIVSATAFSGGVTRADDGVAFFERKIRPVLVEHCYGCHAVGAEEIGGKLLLDSRAAILRGGESGPALVAGDPDESLIVRALRRVDEDFAMPPEDPLPENVAHDFAEWIKMGAPDPRTEAGPEPDTPGPAGDALWSFQPMADPAPPEVRVAEWARDPLDKFVLARLEAAGHRPAGDAPPDVLLRRLYFDLLGLAPTFDELRAFEEAHARDGRVAVEQLVDRLLASPHFGERWGRHWLDVARYAESNGNDGLGRNPTFPHAWRYRDYVVAAFNADTPYDRFLKEQIAGDLLPAASAEERNRNLVATGFLAIGFKPALAMNQDFAMDVVEDQIDVVGTAVMGLSVSCARCHDHKHDPISTRDYYALAGIFNSTETLWGKAGNEKLTANPTPLHELRDSLAKADPQALAAPPKFAEGYGAAVDALKPVVHATLDAKPEGVVVEKGVAFPEKQFAKLEEGRFRIDSPAPADGYSISFWFRNDLKNDARAITAYLFSHAADGDNKQIGDHLAIGGTHDASLTGKLYIWNGTEKDEMAGGSKQIAPGRWHHVVMVRSGTRVMLYLNGDPKPEIDAEMAVAAPEGRKVFVAARNDRFAPLAGSLAELALFDRALDAGEAATLHNESGQRRGTPQPAWAMGVRDKAAVADCKINIDGNSKKLGPVAARGFLPACETLLSPPTVGTGSSGRLQLADWLTRGDHPQTARVMANRIWLHLFGRGIVTTPDDFGVYGARPSHPELLDHLGQRLMDGGWSTKGLIRAIVLSRSYGLDSRCDASDLLESDPDNVLVGRHDRRRLDAESLRDRVLQASGRLQLEPAEGSAIDDIEALINWPPGEAKYLHQPSAHRSIYLCMLRNSPPPELVAFDFPVGIDIAGQRPVTNSPGHALFLLNSPLLVEQAQAFAEVLLADADEEARIAAAYRRALQREPNPSEVRNALDHVRQLAGELGEDPERRAWASLCQALLASNEFRYID